MELSSGNKTKVETSCGGCHSHSSKPDYLLWGSASGVAALYIFHLIAESVLSEVPAWLTYLASSTYDLMNTMWWGITLGIVMVALLSKVPREFVMSILGNDSRSKGRGVIRAAFAGVLLDLCNHGILMVAAKLYERGASIGQTMAFLIASPWNSFSLTLILIALIGLPWTIAFLLLSMLIAILTGWVFDYLVSKRVIPNNPNRADLPENFKFWPQAKKQLSEVEFSKAFFQGMMIDGIKDSRMVLRWILFGILLAGLIRTFVSPEHFATYFGPTLLGLAFTVLVATVLEVCSEGSTPVAADLLTQANAPGNSFAFLMTGVATDYTEIMVIKDATKSWKISLLLPLLTLPQVMIVAWLMNQWPA